jgi:hypothetical protein
MKRGRFTRPKAVVLGDTAIVPRGNLIQPPPNQFTHELRKSQAYYYAQAEGAARPDGELSAGTQVVLMIYDGGPYCRVVDGQGLYVETEYENLQPISR